MKRFLLLLTVCFSVLPLFAVTGECSFALDRKGEKVYPVSSAGVVDNSSEQAVLLLDICSEPYSLSWLESYVDPSVRKAVAELCGPFLQEFLPCSRMLVTRPVTEGECYTLSAVTGEKEVVFTFSGDKIIAISEGR